MVGNTDTRRVVGKRVDAQGQPVGEYLIHSRKRLRQHDVVSLFPGSIVHDFWATSQITYLVRITPDPGLQVVKHHGLALPSVFAVDRLG